MAKNNLSDTDHRQAFAYDYMGRRISKEYAYENGVTANDWVVQS